MILMSVLLTERLELLEYFVVVPYTESSGSVAVAGTPCCLSVSFSPFFHNITFLFT